MATDTSPQADTLRSAPPTRPLTIAMAQAEPVPGNLAANVDKVVAMIAGAAEQGASLVQFPEKFLSGYETALIAADPERHAVHAGDPRLAPIAEACARHRMSAIVGAASFDAGALHVSSVVYDAGGRFRGLHHKQHLFSSEKDLYAAGRHCLDLDVGGWRIGLAICYDTGFAEHARAAALRGCHAYLASALFSKGNGHHESRIWFPARALDNTVYCALSNHVGTTGGWRACGGSAVWDPYGRLVAEADAEAEEILAVTLDPALLADVRQRETMLADFASRADASAFPVITEQLGG